MLLRYENSTKRGPGRHHAGVVNPPGTKRIKRFIRDARGEALSYRADLEFKEELRYRSIAALRRLGFRRPSHVMLQQFMYEARKRMAAEARYM